MEDHLNPYFTFPCHKKVIKLSNRMELDQTEIENREYPSFSNSLGLRNPK